jgi:hypothetical protein
MQSKPEAPSRAPEAVKREREEHTRIMKTLIPLMLLLLCRAVFGLGPAWMSLAFPLAAAMACSFPLPWICVPYLLYRLQLDNILIYSCLVLCLGAFEVCRQHGVCVQVGFANTAGV